MLTIRSNSAARFCDGVSRRSFLKIGGLGLGGLALPQLFQAEAQAGVRHSHKAVIMVYLPGGPPHQDMYDLKNDAPAEVRGPFREIPTNVPGIRICEHLPRIAGMMDKLVPIRSIVGAEGGHDNFQCFTGWPTRNQPPGGWPMFGSMISKLQGPADTAIPPFIGLENKTKHRPYNLATPGFLGVPHRSFQPEGDGKTDLVLKDLSVDRLADRKSLLASFDHFRRDVDGSGLMGGLDAFQQQAFGVLTSSKLAAALDYTKEDPRTIARYGKGDPAIRGDASPRINEHFLIARRLVEAGARAVTVSFGFWDYHGQNHKIALQDFPMFDQAITALVQDLHDRGLDKDVSVVVWGEFGRTPNINKDGGRDHWPRVSGGLLACGGMKTGQVIGATDRLGGECTERPVRFGDVFATLYQNLGLNAHATVNDLSGRPQYLVEPGCEPMRELVS
ncbi:MAG: hypothetical protein RL514_1114 [Verrucomicrobiota bacterium]|jgi:hypothetical protein